MLDVQNYSPSGKIATCQVISDNKGTRYMSYNTVIAFETLYHKVFGEIYVDNY